MLCVIEYEWGEQLGWGPWGIQRIRRNHSSRNPVGKMVAWGFEK